MMISWNTAQRKIFLRSSLRELLIILFLSSAIVLAFWCQNSTEHASSSSLLLFFSPPQPLQPSKPQQNKKLFKKVDLFWQSMERAASHLNDRYATIAKNIAVISTQLNSSSICYQQIKETFQTGVTTKWSTKCKFLFV